MNIQDAINGTGLASSTSGLINGSARDTQAALYREQFDDYVSRFGPKEEQLIAAYGDDAARDASIAEAQGLAQQGMANAQKAQQVTQSRYQAPMTAQEKEAQRRQFSLSSGLASVDTANRTRAHIADRDRNMLSGGLSSFAKREVS